MSRYCGVQWWWTMGGMGLALTSSLTARAHIVHVEGNVTQQTLTDVRPGANEASSIRVFNELQCFEFDEDEPLPSTGSDTVQLDYGVPYSCHFVHLDRAQGVVDKYSYEPLWVGWSLTGPSWPR